MFGVQFGGRIIRVSVVVLFVGLSGALLPSKSRALCDVIPGTIQSYRGSVGTLNRSVAMPGDIVELRLDAAGCDSGAALSDQPGGVTPEDDYVVTLLFEPVGGGARNAVVLSTDCAAVAAETAGCSAALTGTAECVDMSPPERAFSVSFAEQYVRFAFPDTDARVGTGNDDITLSGPVRILITPRGDPLSCGSWSGQLCSQTIGVTACVDELYEANGTCTNSSALVDPTFPHFVALPTPNDFGAQCTTPGTVCEDFTPANRELRVTVDTKGNVLIPMDYRRVLIDNELPIPRVVRGETDVDAFSSAPGVSISLPSNDYLSSYSPFGHRLPIFFSSLDGALLGEGLAFIGTVDASLGVIRIASRTSSEPSGAFLQCGGGARDGLACNGDDGQCPGGSCGPTTCHDGALDVGGACTQDADCPVTDQCGPAIFDFSDRAVAGIGPVVIEEADFQLDAEHPVPLEGRLIADEVYSFVRSEAIENLDLNGDGDATDAVVTVRDPDTGDLIPIGTTDPGRATVRLRELPFTYPAVVVEDDVVVFLEGEPYEGDQDANGDGDRVDTLLRVFRIAGGSATAIGPSPAPAIDAATVVDGRSVAIDGGRLYYRVSEPANSAYKVHRVSVSTAGAEGDGPSGDIFFFDGASPDAIWPPDISGSGRYVAFGSRATNLDGPDLNQVPDIFVHDRDVDEDGVFDEPGATATVRVSKNGTTGVAGNALSFGASISGDGQRVTFTSRATNLEVAGVRGLTLLRPQTVDWYTDTDLDGTFEDPALTQQLGEDPDLVTPGDQFAVGEPLAIFRDGHDEIIVFRPDPCPAGNPPGQEKGLWIVRDGATGALWPPEILAPQRCTAYAQAPRP